MIGVLNTTFKHIFRHVDAHTVDCFCLLVYSFRGERLVLDRQRRSNVRVVKRMQRTSGEQQIGYTTQHDDQQKSSDRVRNTKRRLAVEYTLLF